MATRSPSAKSAKARGGQHGSKSRNTAAATAGEREARSAATAAVAEAAAPQQQESELSLALAELTTAGEAAELSTGQAAHSPAELPDGEITLAPSPARPVPVSNCAQEGLFAMAKVNAPPPALLAEGWKAK